MTCPCEGAEGPLGSPRDGVFKDSWVLCTREYRLSWETEDSSKYSLFKIKCKSSPNHHLM